MVQRNLVHYLKQARTASRRVWATTTTAILRGQAFCYDRDYGTAANLEGRRDTFVELPDTSNNMAFAGVAAYAYAADASGQMIEIYEPGSVCQILADQTCVVSFDNYLTFAISATAAENGIFGVAGFLGRGTARVLQTVDRGSVDGTVLAELLTGPGESGGVQLLDVTTGGAVTCTVGGKTMINAATGTLGADATFTLANGTVEGIRKMFEIDVDLGDSYDLVVTVTSGIQADDSTALASLTMDDDGDLTTVVWAGDKWKLIHNTGSTLGT